MAWQGPSSRKQTDKLNDKAAKAAQAWLKRGFSPEQVADGIYNKVGIETDVKDGKVRFHGCYNDEYKGRSSFYVIREITAESIIRYQK